MKTIKTLLILSAMTLATIFPFGDTVALKIAILSSVALFLFGLILPHLFQYNSLHNKLTIEKPKWSDSIQDKKPMTYVQLIGVLLIAIGIGGLAGGLIKGQTMNFIGLMCFALGMGTFIGIYFALKKKETKKFVKQ